MKNKKISKFNTLSFKRKTVIISFTVILVLLASVGTTLAFLAMKTGSIKNIFEPVTIACQVNDDDYTVGNIGDYSAYIRASVIVNYVKDSDDTVVYGIPPVLNTDYSITFDSNSWIKGSDGFYYYKTPVNAKADTAALITEFNRISQVNGYTLKAQILAEAIQSKPTSTVSDYWNVTVDGNGNITGKKQQ